MIIYAHQLPVYEALGWRATDAPQAGLVGIAAPEPHRVPRNDNRPAAVQGRQPIGAKNVFAKGPRCSGPTRNR